MFISYESKIDFIKHCMEKAQVFMLKYILIWTLSKSIRQVLR